MEFPVRRGTGHITLKSHNPLKSSSFHAHVPSEPHIRCLKGFKTVIVRAIAGDGHRLPFYPAAAASPPDPAPTRVRERLMCEMVWGDLEETSGSSAVR